MSAWNSSSLMELVCRGGVRHRFHNFLCIASGEALALLWCALVSRGVHFGFSSLSLSADFQSSQSPAVNHNLN